MTITVNQYKLITVYKISIHTIPVNKTQFYFIQRKIINGFLITGKQLPFFRIYLKTVGPSILNA